MSLDETDSKLVQHLMRQGRTTWSELANLLGLSAPAAADRVRRLEERGVIRGYAAQISPEAAGCELLAFIAVSLEQSQQRAAFLQRVEALSEIQECHHVTGADDYLLKVRCRNTQALERLISQELKSLDGLKTHTTIALSTVKETSALPLSAS
ncbi:MAG: Lrp/AsnC family transcriptional regulator [Pegethrix bostrychoides GSE-TBD4-15B]|jgi:Lrp/AsnC family leucine-responsive transcriptional regulator|uniref:Lrp/AsnC family transcriptional regulator n=1 Tax=Pegethrix bostrychoides GSE-TBD4-15B TaxID=2839662 RepID=A0A951U4X2_9CYAN|nr:Lrp/AsnC family transcriptional regulator [Pegethrix bostrychoides GSE-TBD4-15B]